MNDVEILNELKKAFALLEDKTYNVQDLQSHILTFIKDNFLPPIAFHKEQVERIIRDTMEVQALQRKYFNGHKSVLPECRAKEANLEKKCKHLLTQGYSIDRFIKQAPNQGDIFGK